MLRAEICRTSLLSVPVYVETGGAGHGPAPALGPPVSKVIAPPAWTFPTRSKETAGQGALTTPKPVKELAPGDCTIVRLPEQVHEPLYPSWGRMNCVSHCVE